MYTGVLITNLGTPDEATPKALKQYLAEFLSDPRVVEIPRLLWLPILYGIILNIRPARSAKLYQKIWMKEGSPLRVYSQRIAEQLQKTLGQENIKIALGMRYGNPSLESALDILKDCKRILIVPLYPQFSATTTGSTFDAIAKVLKTWRNVPKIQFENNYYEEPLYIEAISKSIQDYRAKKGNGAHLVFSFHGLPKRCVELGDPYQNQCFKTVEKITQTLKIPTENYSVVFQSRFGAQEWLQPYCDQTLREMPQRGIKNVVVICPGFAVDCLETLEEVAQQNRDIFLKAGGEKFDYIPALNDSDAQIELLKTIITKNGL